MLAKLQLKKMSRNEKLMAMEALWADLCRDEERLASPAWHAQVLGGRAARVASGTEKFMDWETARRELRDRLT